MKAEEHVTWVEPSPQRDPTHAGQGGWKAACNCGWRGIGGRKKSAAQQEGIGHVREQRHLAR